VDEDSKTFAGRHFANLQDPDEEMLPVLLFWRDAKLAHVEALDWSHFSDDNAKEDLFHREVPRLIRKRQPQLVSLLLGIKTTSGEGPREQVLVTIASATRVFMFAASVSRRADSPPALGPWGPYPEDPALEVRSWINDALQSALASAHEKSGLSRFFGRS
jgi:hypothetical protein